MPQSDYLILGAEIARARKRFITIYIHIEKTRKLRVRSHERQNELIPPV